MDTVLGTVCGPVQQSSFKVIKPGGSPVAITQPPSHEEAAKYNVKASMLVTEVSRASLETVARMADAGEIKPFIGKVYWLAEAARVWRDARANQIEGKLVMAIGE